jgi:hypothetical protein
MDWEDGPFFCPFLTFMNRKQYEYTTVPLNFIYFGFNFSGFLSVRDDYYIGFHSAFMELERSSV